MARRALYVLLAGPDGTGKSTLLALTLQSRRLRHLRVATLHFAPRGGQGGGRPVTNPQGAPPRGAGQYLALAKRFALYRMSSVAGPLSGRGSDLVIQERGWWDQEVDPRRYRLTGATRWLVRLLGRLLRRPVGTVLLVGSPDAVAARKAELESAEVERQIEMWKQVSAGWNRTAIETTRQTAGQSAAEIEGYVVRVRARHISSEFRWVAATPRRLRMCATPGARRLIDQLYQPKSTAGAMLSPVRRFVRLGRVDPSIAARIGSVVAELGIPYDSIAAIKSLGRDQLVLGMEGGAATTFMKLTWGGRDVLRNEARLLAEVSGFETFRVPRVIDLVELGDTTALHMTALDGRGEKGLLSVEHALLVAIELRWARGGLGITHGDFAHWNFVGASLPVGLIDWEKSTLEYHPGFDITRFINTHPRRISQERKSQVLGEYAIACELSRESLVESGAALGLPADRRPERIGRTADG